MPTAAGPFPGVGESSWNALAHRPPTLAGVADDLLLKVTPPRVPRHQIARPRLRSDQDSLRDYPVILVQAPAGYGKTSLLAQWRYALVA